MIGACVCGRCNLMITYSPTTAEAARDLRRWSAGRKQLEELGAPKVWQRIAIDALLAELARLEEANSGMVTRQLTGVRSKR